MIVKLQTKIKIVENENDFFNKLVEQLKSENDIQKMENVDKDNFIQI